MTATTPATIRPTLRAALAELRRIASYPRVSADQIASAETQRWEADHYGHWILSDGSTMHVDARWDARRQMHVVGEFRAVRCADYIVRSFAI
jgi:hypothetical protein